MVCSVHTTSVDRFFLPEERAAVFQRGDQGQIRVKRNCRNRGSLLGRASVNTRGYADVLKQPNIFPEHDLGTSTRVVPQHAHARSQDRNWMGCRTVPF